MRTFFFRAYRVIFDIASVSYSIYIIQNFPLLIGFCSKRCNLKITEGCSRIYSFGTLSCSLLVLKTSSQLYRQSVLFLNPPLLVNDLLFIHVLEIQEVT